MSTIKLVTGSLITGLIYYFEALWFNGELTVILMIAITMDIITGIWAAYSIDKKSVTSSIMTSGILKKAAVLMIPFLMGLAVKGAGFSSLWVVTTICSFLIASEVYSSISNYYSIRKGQRVLEIDAIGLLLDWCKKGLVKIFQSFSGSQPLPEPAIKVQSVDELLSQPPDAIKKENSPI